MARVTHVFQEDRISGYWVPITFITEFAEGDSFRYRKGLKGWKLYTPDEIEDLVKSGEFIPLESPYKLKSNEDIYLSQEGEVWAADEELVSGDPNKTLLGKLQTSLKSSSQEPSN